jgi:hypothetical protein
VASTAALRAATLYCLIPRPLMKSLTSGAAIPLAAFLGHRRELQIAFVDPFDLPPNDRYLRIPAEDRSRPEGSLRIATVDVAVGGNGHFERFTTRSMSGSSPITLTP